MFKSPIPTPSTQCLFWKACILVRLSKVSMFPGRFPARIAPRELGPRGRTWLLDDNLGLYTNIPISLPACLPACQSSNAATFGTFVAGISGYVLIDKVLSISTSLFFFGISQLPLIGALRQDTPYLCYQINAVFISNMKKAWQPRGLSRPASMLRRPAVLTVRKASRRRTFATVAQDSTYAPFSSITA